MLQNLVNIFSARLPQSLTEALNYGGKTLISYLENNPGYFKTAAGAIVQPEKDSSYGEKDLSSVLEFILKRNAERNEKEKLLTTDDITNLLETTCRLPHGSRIRSLQALLFKYGGCPQDPKQVLVLLVQSCLYYGDSRNLGILAEATTQNKESLIRITTTEEIVDLGDGCVVLNVNAPFEIPFQTPPRTCRTYLHFAALYLYRPFSLNPTADFIGVVSLFLKHGASTSIQDESGYTVLHKAVEENSDLLGDLIILMDDNHRSLVELDSDSKTPMELAESKGKVEAFDKLKAALNRKNRWNGRKGRSF
jgi:ankyrin repeat protein